MKKILTVVGTRPNFIKITQFPRVLKNYPEMEYRLCHTGQHFDKNMSDIFFKELKIPEPDYYLGIKPSTTINQLSEIMQGLEKIHFVGNTMIDTLVAFQENIDNSNILEKLGLKPSSFALMTMHRPATVDTKEGLQKLLLLIKEIAAKMPLVFPVHPRTLKNLKAQNMLDGYKTINNLISCEPMGYLDFQNLTKNARFVLTDSGGIQEETTFYKVPCITLRENTERPSTVQIGTNTLVYFDMEKIVAVVNEIIDGTNKSGNVPHLWDGKATERIVEIVTQ